MKGCGNGQIDVLKAAAYSDLLEKASHETALTINRPVTWPPDYVELENRLRTADGENHRLRQRVEELEDLVERATRFRTDIPAGLVEEPADADEKAVG